MAIRTDQDRLLSNLGRTGDTSVANCGGVLIDDTAVHSDNLFSITALSETVINNSGTTSKIADLDTNITIPAGVTIFGQFKAIQLVSGTIIGYKNC
jgi:hypothetical protein